MSQFIKSFTNTRYNLENSEECEFLPMPSYKEYLIKNCAGEPVVLASMLYREWFQRHPLILDIMAQVGDKENYSLEDFQRAAELMLNDKNDVI
jgi:hypothetical protein